MMPTTKLRHPHFGPSLEFVESKFLTFFENMSRVRRPNRLPFDFWNDAQGTSLQCPCTGWTLEVRSVATKHNV